jgi:hypothetical protein
MTYGKCVLASVLLAAGIVPDTAPAAVVTPGASVTITQSYAYTNYNGGDFVFSTSFTAPGCASGWYIKASDGGYRAAIAVVLTAQASGLQVTIYGDNADLWSGSPSGQFCRVQTIGLSS